MYVHSLHVGSGSSSSSRDSSQLPTSTIHIRVTPKLSTIGCNRRESCTESWRRHTRSSYACLRTVQRCMVWQGAINERARRIRDSPEGLGRRIDASAEFNQARVGSAHGVYGASKSYLALPFPDYMLSARNVYPFHTALSQVSTTLRVLSSPSPGYRAAYNTSPFRRTISTDRAMYQNAKGSHS